MVEYGAEKRISQHSSLSGAVSVGMPTGVMLKIKLVPFAVSPLNGLERLENLVHGLDTGNTACYILYVCFRLTRGSHAFVFPIHLCEEVLMAPIFYATIVPVVSWLTIKALFIDPINREKQLREREKTRETNKARYIS